MNNIKVENQIVMKRINEIKPYVRNPRKNDKTVEMLMKIIPKVGFNVPLVIDEKGVIVKGHARFSAAIKLGMTELPCIITHADEEAIKADRIADNKISEFSEWVNEELMHELDMIDFDFDFSELGFPVTMFDDMPTMEEFMVEESEDKTHKLSEEERQKLFQEFLERQAKENEAKVQMTTETAIRNAQQRQIETAGGSRSIKPQNYYKCVCEKCGHIMFVAESELWNPEDGLVRGAYK